MNGPEGEARSGAARAAVLMGLRCRLGTGPCEDPTAQYGVAWPDLVALAVAQGVAPLLYSAWRDADWLPEAARHLLRAEHAATASRNALVGHFLAQQLAALAAADVPVVVLKGPALLATVYRNPALRPMVDVDLLVDAADLPRAAAALAALGYRPARAVASLDALVADECELALLHPDERRLPVELHWSLVDVTHYQARLDMAWFRGSAVPAMLGELPLTVLSPTAQLLHLAAHQALHHPGYRLIWPHDIAELLTRQSEAIDWPLLAERASTWDLVRPVRDAVTAAATDWQVALPAGAAAALAPLRPRAVEGRLLAQASGAQRDVARRLLWDAAGLRGWRRRGAFVARQLLPGPAYMRERYGVRTAAQLPAAYAARWWAGLRALVGR